MHHFSRTNLSLDDVVKKPLQGKNSITFIITLFKKKALNQNTLAEIKLEICRIPRSRNGSPPLGFLACTLHSRAPRLREMG